jgi:hypothetical protein
MSGGACGGGSSVKTCQAPLVLEAAQNLAEYIQLDYPEVS